MCHSLLQVVAIKGQDLSEVRLPNGKVVIAFAVKTLVLVGFDGKVLSCVMVLGDQTMPKGAWICVPIKGLGPSEAFPGFLVVANSSTPTVEMNEFFFRKIFLPDMERRRRREVRRRASPGVEHPPEHHKEEMVISMDGESQQVDAVLNPELQKHLAERGLDVVKIPAWTSSVAQVNDFGSLHAVARSGSQGVTDVHWQEKIEEQLASISNKDKRANMKPADGEQPFFVGTVAFDDWTVSPNAQKRIKRAMKIMPPAYGRAFSRVAITNGVKESGFDISDEFTVKPDLDQILRAYPATNHADAEQLEILRVVAEKAKDKVMQEGLAEIEDKHMLALGLDELPLPKKCGTVGDVLADGKQTNRRRAMLLSKFDFAAYEEKRRIELEAAAAAKRAEKDAEKAAKKAARQAAAAVKNAAKQQAAAAKKAAKKAAAAAKHEAAAAIRKKKQEAAAATRKEKQEAAAKKKAAKQAALAAKRAQAQKQ